MTFETIYSTDHSSLQFIQPLYENAFPLHERREWAQLLQLLSQPDMQLLLIKDEDIYVGFAIVWSFADWHYLEHLAVDPQHRGKKYGSTVMQELLKYSGNRLVLEVEHPHDEAAKRRIGFYERLGFTILPFEYQQPPYRKGEAFNPMLLMSIPVIDNEDIFNAIAALIKERVYLLFH
ncbi:MAG: GNAT family N-acetyltransferase [Chitinophagaceae bacterium]